MNTEEKKYRINLCMEQIKYLRDEYVAIQNKFLADSTVLMSLLAVVAFQIETSSKIYARSIYLILPFLYSAVPFNLIKYTTRMLVINNYIMQMENKINLMLGEEKLFFWNSKMIFRPGPFGIASFLAQIPIQIISIGFLMIKFVQTLIADSIFLEFHALLILFLIFEGITLIIMLIDAAQVALKNRKNRMLV